MMLIPQMPDYHRKHSLLISAVIFLYVPFLIKFGWRLRHKEAMDFSSYYAASVSAFSNHVSPYSTQALQEAMGNHERVWPYLYSPPSLLFFSPLILCNYQNSKLVFLCLNHLFLLFLIWFIPRLASARLLTFALFISFGPVAWTLQLGQVNILLLFLLVLFWFFSKNKQQSRAGLALALSVLLKSYPILLIAPLLITKKYKEVFHTFLFLTLISLLSLLFLPENTWSDWFTRVVPGGGYLATPEGLFHPGAEWNQSINGFLSKLHLKGLVPLWSNEKLVRQWAYLGSGFVLMILLIVSWRIRQFQSSSLDRILVITLPTLFLVAPFSWDHHLVYMIPAILLMLTCRFETFKTIEIALWGITTLVVLILSAENIPQMKFAAMLAFWLLAVYMASSKNSRFVSDRRP